MTQSARPRPFHGWRRFVEVILPAMGVVACAALLWPAVTVTVGRQGPVAASQPPIVEAYTANVAVDLETCAACGIALHTQSTTDCENCRRGRHRAGTFDPNPSIIIYLRVPLITDLEGDRRGVNSFELCSGCDPSDPAILNAGLAGKIAMERHRYEEQFQVHPSAKNRQAVDQRIRQIERAEIDTARLSANR